MCQEGTEHGMVDMWLEPMYWDCFSLTPLGGPGQDTKIVKHSTCCSCDALPTYSSAAVPEAGYAPNDTQCYIFSSAPQQILGSRTKAGVTRVPQQQKSAASP